MPVARGSTRSPTVKEKAMISFDQVTSRHMRPDFGAECQAEVLRSSITIKERREGKTNYQTVVGLVTVRRWAFCVAWWIGLAVRG